MRSQLVASAVVVLDESGSDIKAVDDLVYATGRYRLYLFCMFVSDEGCVVFYLFWWNIITQIRVSGLLPGWLL